VSEKRTILIVAPDGAHARTLAPALTQAGYAVEAALAVDEAMTADLLLVDVSGGATWPDAERLASRFILVVDGVGDMRRGFGMGAEDCILADAHPDEVVARCDALLRRTDRLAQAPEPQADAEAAVYVDKRLWVNFGSHQVWVRGRGAHLTPREFHLLAFLIRHRDETLDHERILGSVWGRELTEAKPTEVLKQYIWRLRQKIEEDPNAPETILTDPGAGYRFVSRLD
jgi:two-component system KDP operon response regulator KdpE